MIEIIWEVLIPLASTALLVLGLADSRGAIDARRSHDVSCLLDDALGAYRHIDR